MNLSILLSLLPMVAALPSLQRAVNMFHDPNGQSPHTGRLSVVTARQFAFAQFDFKDYELTNVCFDCYRTNSTSQYACSMKFNWYDPNSILENNVTSCTCKYNWTWDGETNTNPDRNTYSAESYTSCFVQMPQAFQMKIDSFNGGGNFSLAMTHRYKDSHNFTPPWDYPMTYSYPNFSLPTEQDNSNSMTWYDPGPLYAAIDGVTD